MTRLRSGTFRVLHVRDRAPRVGVGGANRTGLSIHSFSYLGYVVMYCVGVLASNPDSSWTIMMSQVDTIYLQALSLHSNVRSCSVSVLHFKSLHNLRLSQFLCCGTN